MWKPDVKANTTTITPTNTSLTGARLGKFS